MRVGEFLHRLGDDGIAVVIQPIDQRTDGGIFLILDERGVIEGAHEITARTVFLEELAIIDVEAKAF